MPQPPTLPFITLILTILLTINCCQPTYELPNIETGIANFQPSPSPPSSQSQSTYRYTYFSQFVEQPQIAFAVNNLQGQNLVESTGFGVMVMSKNLTEVGFLLVCGKGWNLVTVNFLIARRDDLHVGTGQLEISKSVTLSATNTTTPQSSTTLLLPLTKPINPTKSTCRVFLNGFTPTNPTHSPQLPINLSIDTTSLTQQSISIQVSGTSLNQTRKLWVSYLVYETSTAGFVSYGGRIAKRGFQGIESSNLHRLVYRSQYKLFGMNGIQLTQPTIGMITSLSSDFVATVYSSGIIASLTLDYIVIGVQPKTMCGHCSENQSQNNTTLLYAYESECLEKCPKDSYVFRYQDGAYACLKCSSSMKMRLRVDGKGCECVDGFSLDGTQCVFGVISNIILTQVEQYRQQPINITPTAPTTTPLNNTILPLSINTTFLSTSNKCYPSIPNSYFDGNLCHCKPGYKNVSDTCLLSTAQTSLEHKQLSPIPLLFLKTNMSLVNFTCYENEILVDGRCVSNAQVDGSVACTGSNQINNGLGYCVCKAGYYSSVNGTCVTQKPCPPNSTRLPNGTCQCLPSFTSINGECSRCLPNQLWVPSQSQCLTICGQNSFLNPTTSQCQCLPSFGIYRHNTCQYCPPERFLFNNYCVSCPVNQHYNHTLKKCQCNEEFYLQQTGQCVSKCPNNEYYDRGSMSCKCRLSLGRYNGVCQVCPVGYFVNPFTQECVTCRENQVYSEGRCICVQGYAQTEYGACVKCGDVKNTFMVKGGRCATCPGEMVWNGGKCGCPVGTRQAGLRCVEACRTDQILDQSGNCYECPINQVISNNQCTCRKGYQRIDGACQLVCPFGSFIYKNRCAMCPPNKIFNTQINGCVCQGGFYLNPYNQCQKLTTIAITACPANKYMDVDFGCQDCSPYCVNCQNSTSCVKCQSPYLLTNGKCQADYCGNGILSSTEQCDDGNLLPNDGCSTTCTIDPTFTCSGSPSTCTPLLSPSPPLPLCGNGIIQTSEQCDDSNTQSGDGCSSSCIIERLFTCYGQPSTCKYNATANVCGNGFVEYSEKCDDGNFVDGDGCGAGCVVELGYTCTQQPSICVSVNSSPSLTLYGQIRYNLNNIYISLLIPQPYQFTSQSQSQNFIRATYVTTPKPTTYCSQRQYPELDVFDCLLLYSSGVPNKAFQVEFAYTRPGDGQVGKVVVEVDALMGQAGKVRSLKRSL